MKRLRFDVVREIVEPFAGNLNDGVSRDSFLPTDVLYDGLVEGNAQVMIVYLCTVAEGAVVFVDADDGDGRGCCDHIFTSRFPSFASHPYDLHRSSVTTMASTIAISKRAPIFSHCFIECLSILLSFNFPEG